jgi:protein involved in polysaccharide export with SLBB domain
MYMNNKSKFLVCLVISLALSLATAAYADDYVLGEGDIVKITVYDNPDLTTVERISGSGSIQFPLIGEIRIAGLTISKATKMISDRLADGYIVSPQVNIFLQEYRTSKVYVNGEVKKADAYKYEAGMTVLRLITIAGGFSDKAATGRVKIIRKINNKEEILEKVRMDEPVLPGDMIVVPESFF